MAKHNSTGTARGGGAKLVAKVSRAGTAAKAALKGAAKAAKVDPGVAGKTARQIPKAKPDRGAVDAPGKRHRKPTPNVKLDERMGEPVGKQMGQKNFQVGKSRGRG